MGGDKELRSQDMINVLQRSQVVCKGSEYGGSIMAPVRKPILFLEIKAIRMARDQEA